jgi:hypothetical protein
LYLVGALRPTEKIRQQNKMKKIKQKKIALAVRLRLLKSYSSESGKK